jgi:hypothetical protein
MTVFAYLVLFFNSLLLLRLGLLPLIFYARNYRQCRPLFWIAALVTGIFSLSTVFIVSYLRALDAQ